MTDQIGNGSMPLRIGNLINTTVYGGPYRDVPVDFFGVKMAEEIDHPHMVDIPTKDYCVPKVSDLRAGIVRTLMGIINEEVIYVGCWGGIGRTGIFLAALAKVQIEYRKTKHRGGRGEDPVLYVRKHFIPHAVETQEQIKFIEDFDVSSIVEWLNVTQVALGKNIGFQRKQTDLVSMGQTDRLEAEGDAAMLHQRYRTGYKERFANMREVTNDEYQHQTYDEFGDTDSGNPDDLQTQIWKMEERVDTLQRTVAQLVIQNNQRAQTLQKVIAILNTLTRTVDSHVEEHLTKPTLYERLGKWFSNLPRYHF